MAAVDVLEKVKMGSPDVNLMMYALFPGMLISPTIYTDLHHFCVLNQLAFPVFSGLSVGEFGNGPIYGVECRVGRLRVVGK
jgi:hypothetical protein